MRRFYLSTPKEDKKPGGKGEDQGVRFGFGPLPKGATIVGKIKVTTNKKREG